MEATKLSNSKTLFAAGSLLEILSAEVTRFLEKEPSNRMGEAWGGERMWEQTLLGSARGDDPIFDVFKEAIEPLHWTPADAFAAGGFTAGAEELAAVSWVLPHSAVTKKDNALQKDMPSERWARSRSYGEEVNVKLRAHLVEFLKDAGIDAVAPMNLPGWTRLDSERYGYASNWSERHIAYACGLGTFGLSQGLITPLGKAVRFGSIVLRGQVNPPPRPYVKHDEYCPFKADKTCGACIRRCPAGAISENGIAKLICSDYTHDKVIPHVEEHYGFTGYGCGLCQTGVPCTSGIPGRAS